MMKMKKKQRSTKEIMPSPAIDWKVVARTDAVAVAVDFPMGGVIDVVGGVPPLPPLPLRGLLLHRLAKCH